MRTHQPDFFVYTIYTAAVAYYLRILMLLYFCRNKIPGGIHMSISGIQSVQDVYAATFEPKTSKLPINTTIGQTAESDTVYISDKAKELAQKDQAETNQGNVVNDQSDSDINDLPLEALALPSWYADYLPDALKLTPKINHDYWDLVADLTKDNYLSDDERTQLRNYLLNDPIHQERLAKTEFMSQYKDELSDYMELIENFRRESYEENGVFSITDYYEKAFLDEDNNEKIYQSFQERIENSPRALELMEILGIKSIG